MKKCLFKIAFTLSSPRLTAFLLFYAVIFIFAASLKIPSLGVPAVQAQYFESWFCLIWKIPFLGGKFIGLCALINLFASSLRFGGRGLAGLGFSLVHIALMLLIVSAFLQGAWRKEGSIFLNLNESSNKIHTLLPDGSVEETFTIPFYLELVKVEEKSWENTNIPSHYSSLVKFHYQDKVQEKLISMNKPASFGSWTFYQFRIGGKSSELQAVRNPASLLPIVAITLIFIGMLYTFLFKIFYKR